MTRCTEDVLLFALALSLTLLAACASTPAPALDLQSHPQGAGPVEVTVVGFEHEGGLAMVALFVSEAGWPDDDTQAHSMLSLPIREQRVVAQFDEVPVGPFAIAVFHDENEDGALDQNILGIPTEPYGFSQDARGTFGPPSFESARLDFSGGQAPQIMIEVR